MKLNIQIIEDNEQDIALLVNALKQSGFECDIKISRTIEEAITLNNRNNFDCIFLDYYFPVKNGSDYLRYYNDRKNSGNVIMVTSQEDVHMAVECMKLGASDFLTKTQITPASIGKSLRYVLKLKEARETTERAEAALLESELKLKNIIARSPIILFNIKASGEITLFKGKAATNISIKPESIVGRNLSEFTNELPIRIEDFNKACMGQEVSFKTEVSGHYFDVSYIAIRNEHKEITGMMGVAIEITSFIRNEEELKNTIEVKEEAAKIKEQFLANISHEIRTPIHGIISLTQFVLNTRLNNEQQQYMELIRKSADTLLVIVNDILDISKIDSGKMIFEETPFHLKDTIHTAVAAFIPKTMEKNIQLKTDFNQNLPNHLCGDPVRLTQIINNLLGNAVKFTDKGFVSIGARIKEQNAEQAIIEFCIQDSGIGIPASKISTIFESFTQAGDDVTRKYGGTGLGLTITKQLIERQHGTLEVQSMAGIGTTFTFSIPYKHSAAHIAVPASIVDQKMEITPGIKLLVAEDHDINRFIIERMLKEWNCSPDFVTTGAEAVAAAARTVYDVILMDVEMPDMNGYCATELIRNTLPMPHNCATIIAMTGHAMPGEQERCLKSGMDDYLSKPFKPKSLFKKIAELTYSKVTGTPESNHDSNKEEPAEPTKTCTGGTKGMPVIELSFLRSISENNEQFFREFIQMFLTNTPKTIEEIETAIHAKNWEKIRMAAHKIKPSFNYVGLKEQNLQAAKIEELAKKKEGMDTIIILMEHLKAACVIAFPQLEAEIKIATT